MQVTNRNAREEVPFGDVPMSGGFIYNDKVFMKVTLPDGKPAAVLMKSGETTIFKATVFVYPISMEAFYS